METWLPVDGWPYEVSDLGRVRRALDKLYTNSAPDGVLKGSWGGSEGRYPIVKLCLEGRTKTVMVHRLVAIAFLGPAPTQEHEVAHNDGDCANCAAANLRWATHEENEADKERHGTLVDGERVNTAKLTRHQARIIRRSGLATGALARRFDVSPGTIRQIRRGDSWKRA